MIYINLYFKHIFIEISDHRQYLIKYV